MASWLNRNQLLIISNCKTCVPLCAYFCIASVPAVKLDFLEVGKPCLSHLWDNETCLWKELVLLVSHHQFHHSWQQRTFWRNRIQPHWPRTQHTAQLLSFPFSSSLALTSLQPLLNERTIMTFIHHHSWFYRDRRHSSTWQPDRQCKWATCASISSFVCQEHSRDVSAGFDAVWAEDGAAMLTRKMAGWGGGRGVLVMCSL